jgi:hypothetical protein
LLVSQKSVNQCPQYLLVKSFMISTTFWTILKLCRALQQQNCHPWMQECRVVQVLTSSRESLVLAFLLARAGLELHLQ